MSWPAERQQAEDPRIERADLPVALDKVCAEASLFAVGRDAEIERKRVRALFSAGEAARLFS